MTEVSTLRLVVAAGLSGAVLLESLLALSPFTVWALSIPLLVWCASPFHAGLVRGLREQRANADMLVSLTVGSTFLFSSVAVFAPLQSGPSPIESLQSLP